MLVDEMSSFIVMDILEKAKGLESQGINIIHMEVGEPDFEPAECVRNAITEAVERKCTHYTHSLGDIELRNQISRFYRREYAVDVSPEQILVTSGSSPAILMTLLSVCEPGSEVIVSNPGYACYKNFILACNATPVFVDLDAEDGFQYSAGKIKDAITDKTRAIVVNSPMNPTGTLLSDATMKEIARIDIPIISDEIYHGLVYNNRARSILEFTKNAFVLNGFSKRYAMTGLRLGYVVAPMEYMRRLQVLQQNLFICAPSISQQAGIAALKYADEEVRKQREIYDGRRKFMIARLREIGFVIEKEPEGAFYIFCNAKNFTSDSYRFAIELLENAHVGVTPGIDFGSNGEGYIRFSYAKSIENLKEGLNRIEAYLRVHR